MEGKDWWNWPNIWASGLAWLGKHKWSGVNRSPFFTSPFGLSCISEFGACRRKNQSLRKEPRGRTRGVWKRLKFRSVCGLDSTRTSETSFLTTQPSIELKERCRLRPGGEHMNKISCMSRYTLWCRLCFELACCCHCAGIREVLKKQWTGPINCSCVLCNKRRVNKAALQSRTAKIVFCCSRESVFEHRKRYIRNEV